MRIAILTTPEPIYHPAFFDNFLRRRGRDTAGVFLCRTRGKQGKSRGMVWQFHRFRRSFGLWNAAKLAGMVVRAKIADKAGAGKSRGRFHSIQAAAQHHGVPWELVDDVNAPQFLDRLRHLGVDLILSVSCPQIFRRDLIALPKLGCLNLHGADLPYYRGLMPSFWMMANGEKEAAVSIFYVNEGVDTGDIIAKRRFPILPGESLYSFIVRSRREACDLALEAIDQIEAGAASRTPLEGEGSYFGWPTREAYRQFRHRGFKLW